LGSEKGKRPEYRIDFLKSATSELARLPLGHLRRVADAIDNLKRDPEPPGHIVLKSYEPAIRRITVDNYRVLYQIKEKFLLVLVVKIGDRTNVYPEFARLMHPVLPARHKKKR
jgi:mRNA interferase RelE/StbE